MSSRLPQSRAERLIAGGRLILAVASFGAIYFDPLEPAQLPVVTYSMLGAYVLYSLVVLLWSAFSPVTSRRWQIISHVLDLVFFGTLNVMTFGPASPFFIYFVFSIVCSMLRFSPRGTIATATAAVVVFVATGIGHVSAAEFELNRFVIRAAYLLVVASMLIYLSGYHDRVQRDLARIARWSRSTSPERDELASHLMREASSIFEAPRVLFAYQHLSERHAYSGRWDADFFRASAEPSGTADLLLDGARGTYVSSAALAAVPLDFDDSITRPPPTPSSAPGLPPALVERYAIDTVVATWFKGDFVRGRLLLLDGRLPLLEEVNLAKIAGGVIAGRLDHFHAAQQLQRGAVAEERVRVARDLHDSVLQSLTGVALQLRTLPRLMQRNPEEAQQRFSEIEQVIVRDQRELRWFIDALRPEVQGTDERAVSLADRLGTLAERFHDGWGLSVENEVAPVVHLLPPNLRHEIYALVSEAVANAAKHAGAKRVSVAIDVDNRHVRIDVVDDGHRFPFHGRYDLASLVASKRGPNSLKERVSSLGGIMVVNSSEEGAKLEIRVPLLAVEA